VKIVFFSISFKKGNRFDYSIHNIFADSYNLLLMKKDKTERAALFFKQPYRSCLENPLIVVNAVTGISTSGYTIN
jgi:hypothetical protein